MKKAVKKLARKKRLQKSEKKSNFLKKRNIYMYNTLIMKEKKQNENPFSYGKTVIQTVVTITLGYVLNDNFGTPDYVLPILNLVTDIFIDWVSKKVNNDKTKI